MRGGTKGRLLLATLLACAVALLRACSSSTGSDPQDSAVSEQEEMTVRITSSEDDVAWGCTLSAVVTGEPEGAELAYDWQMLSASGDKWLSFGESHEEGRQRSLTTEREWTGLYWRCVVTATVDGEEAAAAASRTVGPIASQHAKFKDTVHHPEPMRVGKTVSVELELPEGTEALVRWMRAPSWDGEYEYIDGATGTEYTLTDADLGCYIACRVDPVGAGYIFDGDTEKVLMPVLAASGGSGSGSASVVYVCDGAGESWYHTYDCDELSRLRQLGYSTREVSLAEAKAYCTPCPYCMQ